MNKEQKSWAEKWWRDLPKHHFTSFNKGSKAECMKEIEKLNPDQKLMEHIDWYTRELTLRTARLKSAGIKVAGWKHAVRLIKYRFFEDDLVNVESEKKVKADGENCRLCDRPMKYGAVPAHLKYLYPNDLRLCEYHYEKAVGRGNMERNRAALKNEGLYYDQFATAKECIAACKERVLPRLKTAVLADNQAKRC